MRSLRTVPARLKGHGLLRTLRGESSQPTHIEQYPKARSLAPISLGTKLTPKRYEKQSEKSMRCYRVAPRLSEHVSIKAMQVPVLAAGFRVPMVRRLPSR
jgi:hypothetical protein